MQEIVGRIHCGTVIRLGKPQKNNGIFLVARPQNLFQQIFLSFKNGIFS